MGAAYAAPIDAGADIQVARLVAVSISRAKVGLHQRLSAGRSAVFDAAVVEA
jgi:hypothetical protein